MYPLKTQRVFLGQTEIQSDAHADAWRETIRNVHLFGSKIIFQVAFGGLACTPEANEGRMPTGPSPIYPNTKSLYNSRN